MYKRSKNIVFIVLIFLLLVGQKTWAMSGNILNIKMNKEDMKVREVPVILNGNIIKSESPSFLYVDRTLVSARLIAENYGAKVSWDHPTSTVTIEHEGNIVKLKINKDEALVNGEIRKLDKYSTPRLVSFGGENAVTMVPLTFMADILGYETDWDYDQKAAYLKKKSSTVEEVKPVEPIIKNEVVEIEKGKKNGLDSLVIYGTNNMEVTTMKLSNPTRFVVDIMDSNLKGSDYKEYNHSLGSVKKVRASQYTGDSSYPKDKKVVRVVLDMHDHVASPEVAVIQEDGKLHLIPEVDPWDSISYQNNILRIDANRNIEYSLNYEEHGRYLDILIPGDSSNLESGKLNLTASIVSHIEVKESGNKKNIRVYFKFPVKYSLLTGQMVDKIEIQFSKNNNIKKEDRIIVIDPGHGGSDPGASTAKGIPEKSVVLNTSLKVERKLKERGYNNVLMTRSNDRAVGLYDRSKYANENFADIFVSIHANAANGAASGIETFVPRTVESALKKEQGNKLASLIQEELIRETNAINRGVKQANHAVTRTSNMAAVLVEIGFLTNEKEAALITADWYQEKLAEAIVRGIDRYFDIY